MKTAFSIVSNLHVFIYLCCLFSLLSHFSLITFPPTPALSTISRPLSSYMCPITPQTAVAIATCEVQVSAADSQTVPTVAAGVSKPLCCRLTLTLTLTSENLSLYTNLLFYKPIINSNLISKRWTYIQEARG